MKDRKIDIPEGNVRDKLSERELWLIEKAYTAGASEGYTDEYAAINWINAIIARGNQAKSRSLWLAEEGPPQGERIAYIADPSEALIKMQQVKDERIAKLEAENKVCRERLQAMFNRTSVENQGVYKSFGWFDGSGNALKPDLSEVGHD